MSPVVRKIDEPPAPEPKANKFHTIRAFYDALLADLAAGDYGQVDFEGEQPATIKQGLQGAAKRRGLTLQFLHRRGSTVFRLIKRQDNEAAESMY